jgi:hypothetical protein
MPYENMADVERESLRCWICGRMLTPEIANDVYIGASVELLVCHACGCRWYAGDRAKLASATR